MDHGLALGTRLSPVRLGCTDGLARTFAAPGEVQVITFATPYDCSRCAPHLATVPELEKKAGAGGRAFLVAWAPNPAQITRALGHRAVPTCVDRDGTIWGRYNLLHTPFTAVIRHGTVVYLNDDTFLRPESRSAFIADVAALMVR